MRKEFPNARAKRNYQTFMRRSLSIYNNMLERYRKTLPEEPPKLREIAKLPFPRERLRAMIEAAIGQKCIFCRETMTAKTISVDHETPIVRGGKWGSKNLTIICHSCNMAKSNLTAEEFERVFKVLRTFDPTIKRQFLGRLKAGAMVVRLHFGRGRKK